MGLCSCQPSFIPIKLFSSNLRFISLFQHTLCSFFITSHLLERSVSHCEGLGSSSLLSVRQKTSTMFFALGGPLSQFPQAWREGHRQAAKDFRTRWRRCGSWFLIAFWLGILVFILVELVYTNMNQGLLLANNGACLPDRSFGVDPNEFRYFSSSAFFQITLGFGNMDFTQAKAIDVVWDILVGRGGQALIAYISWRTFANYVTTSMEVAPITFKTYRTIFLPNGSLLVATLHMIRDFTTRHGLHSKIAMCFMVFTMVFTLAFPSFASAMTGYNGNVKPFVLATDGNYVPFDSFHYAYYVIYDGWRVDKGGEYIVADPGGLSQPTFSSEYPSWIFTNCTVTLEFQNECAVPFAVSDYVRNYGLNGEAANSSTFLGHNLGPPVLNITAFQLPWTLNNRLAYTREVPNKNLRRWAYGNNTYTFDDLQQRGKCQAVLDYQWGFSLIQLFIMVIIFFFWTVGIFVMWLTSQSTMKTRGRNDVAGENKAILELSDAIRDQLGEISKEEGVSTLTESVINDRLQKDLRGGSISYSAPLLSNGEVAQKRSFLIWAKDNKWLVSFMFLFIATTAVCGVFVPFVGFFLVILSLDLIIAVAMGSTRKSRWVFFFWSFVIFGVVPTIALLPLYMGD
ncbi:nad dependent epimerase dehydratase [Pyrenophora seminiperda CCB06]|uniref:Nad dependent epimerase dehydratase n=1 Tax=Pyrenophora seminiperda CCB06 TaxID=1302712 RepID=A0A3M7MGZ6_9PLEO|nr:nad dependent epimerase dehydratase [Pyrenophora seminiperda CCB06]